MGRRRAARSRTCAAQRHKKTAPTAAITHAAITPRVTSAANPRRMKSSRSSWRMSPMIAIGSVINERCIVVNRTHTVYAREKAPRPAGPLIRATTIPTEKFDADATHWSTIVVVARDAAPPRKPHRVRNRVAEHIHLPIGHGGVRFSLASVRAIVVDVEVTPFTSHTSLEQRWSVPRRYSHGGGWLRVRSHRRTPTGLAAERDSPGNRWGTSHPGVSPGALRPLYGHRHARRLSCRTRRRRPGPADFDHPMGMRW